MKILKKTLFQGLNSVLFANVCLWLEVQFLGLPIYAKKNFVLTSATITKEASTLLLYFARTL